MVTVGHHGGGLSWDGLVRVRLVLRLKSRASLRHTESGRFEPGALTAPPTAFSVTVGLRRGRLLCTWPHPHFPLVLNSETQWLSTYPGATELAYRRWHPIMCLFKALFLRTACLECLSSYALFHSERIQLKSVHLGMEEVRFHN